MSSRAVYPLFVRRDLDGFFGLLIDNLVQLLAIVGLCGGLCGMNGPHAELLYAYILPGAAVSVLFGNLFYAWQARRLAARENRSDVTALPYGINTPSMIVYIYFVILPTYASTGDPRLAWLAGLVACLGSGVIEFLSAFVAESVRKSTPRAALLSTLAGIAIGFISMSFALQIFERPLVAMLPLALILVTLFAGFRFPWGLPGGLVAILSGTAVAWLLTLVKQQFPDAPTWLSGSAMDPAGVRLAWQQWGLSQPLWVVGEVVEFIDQHRKLALQMLTVIVPMGLFNVIGSLQNIESAEAAGDGFDTRSSLAVNGLGTLLAGCCGSCFPTTIYIGHPGWKGLGARAGYSVLNGIVITAMCLLGVVGMINAIVPLAAGIAIVLWIGIIITAQAFQATPARHAPAVAMGLFPAIAAWGATVVGGAFFAAEGATLQELLEGDPATVLSGFSLHGMIVIERGYIFTCMILAAISAFLIDRRYFTAAGWSLIAAALTGLGLMHAYQVHGNNVDFLFRFAEQDTSRDGLVFPANGLVIGYALFAIVFALVGLYCRQNPAAAEEPGHEHV